MEDIVHKIAMLEIEVLFYKMMTGCLANSRLKNMRSPIIKKQRSHQILGVKYEPRIIEIPISRSEYSYFFR